MLPKATRGRPRRPKQRECGDASSGVENSTDNPSNPEQAAVDIDDTNLLELSKQVTYELYSAPQLIRREDAINVLALYLVQSGDQSVWDEGMASAVRRLRYGLGTRQDVIAYHLGVSVRSVYRIIEETTKKPVHPLDRVMNACKHPRSAIYLRERLKGLRRIDCVLLDWLRLLVRLGYLVEDGTGKFKLAEDSEKPTKTAP